MFTTGEEALKQWEADEHHDHPFWEDKRVRQTAYTTALASAGFPPIFLSVKGLCRNNVRDQFERVVHIQTIEESTTVS